MGTEMLVALGALTLAAAAVIKLAGLSKRLQRAEFNAAQESQSREDWQERLEGLEMIESGEPVLNDVPYVTDIARQVRQLESTVQVLELRAREHDALLRSLVTEDEALHLWNISRDTSTLYERHPGVEAELRSLVRRGLLEKKVNFKIHELSGSFDLLRYFKLTEAGEILLSLRTHLEETDRRIKESMPPQLSKSDRDSLGLESPKSEVRALL